MWAGGRRAATLLAAAAGGAAAGAAGFGLYGTRLLVHPGSLRRSPRDVDVVETVTDSDLHVTLTGPGARRGGLVGLDHRDGYLWLGDQVDPDDGDVVRRPILDVRGALPRSGPAVIDDYLYGPQGQGLDVPLRSEPVPSPAGPLPCDWFDGDPTRVAIHVHGRGAVRAQCYRLIPTFAEHGWTSMVVSYRNDADAPAASDGRYGLGGTEWRDLAAAVVAARRHGAQQVVLVGWSMGAAAVATLLRRRTLAAELVEGVVLDSPALEWTAILRHIARGARLPGWLVPLVVGAGRVRAGIDWQALDHVSAPDHLARPMVLVHGDADRVVPVDMSDVLAGALGPNVVDYVRVAGAGHTRSFNHAHGRYAAAVSAMLEGIPRRNRR